MTIPYLAYYGLAEAPFGLTSDPRFVYESRGYSQAIADVTSAVERHEGLVMITGGPGTGKTMVCRALMQYLGPDTRLTAVPSPFISGGELMIQIVADFSLTHPDELEEHLRTLLARGTPAVVVIDEAQHLNANVLEQIRLLSNFEAGDARLLQIILVGQPDLRSVLKRTAPSLEQRVTRRCSLVPMAPDEVARYIDHRLAVAGATDLSFRSDAIDLVAHLSRGVPRVVNQLCDRALEIGAGREARVIDRAAVSGAAARLDLLGGDPEGQTRSRTAVMAAVAGVLAVMAVGLWLWIGRIDRKAAPPLADGVGTATGPPAVEAPPEAAPAAPPMPAPSAVPLVGTIPAADSVLLDVAAYADQSQANRVVRELGTRGLPVFSRFDPRRRVHQVLVGPYVSREEALAAKKQVEALKYAKSRITVESSLRRSDR